LDKLPTAEEVVIKAVPESNDLLPECTSALLAHQVCYPAHVAYKHDHALLKITFSDPNPWKCSISIL
jgi:hypothetical protein